MSICGPIDGVGQRPWPVPEWCVYEGDAELQRAPGLHHQLDRARLPGGATPPLTHPQTHILSLSLSLSLSLCSKDAVFFLLLCAAGCTGFRIPQTECV